MRVQLRSWPGLSPDNLSRSRGPVSKMAHSCGWQVSAGCCQKASVLSHEELSIELLECSNNTAAGFLQSE